MGAAVALCRRGLHSPTVHPTAQFIPEDIVRTVPYLFLIALITGALRSRIRALDDAASAFRAEQAANEREMEVAAQGPESPAARGNARRSRASASPLSTSPPGKSAETSTISTPSSEDCVGVVVADVSGKGVPAALLVGGCKYAVRESYTDDLSRMTMSSTNSDCWITADETFVTMLYGVLDVPTGRSDT